MTLQAKLTLGSVGLVSVMVGIVSALDLANEMQRQFEATLERADLLKTVASGMVSQSLNRQLTRPFREALRDPGLQSLLVDILTAGHAILEVAVVDPHNEVLADSDPARLGSMSPPYPEFRPLVTSTPWYQKLQILQQGGERDYYQLEQELGTSGGEPLLYVRIIIAPALIREDINPVMRKDANVAVASVIASVCFTFLLSAVAFRPLGHLGHLLDQVARGEYEPAPQPAPKTGDDVSLMASKVSLLGQKLRGAEFEVSDLRGNIERVLRDLEDAVFIFSRELNLVFASGAVERFIGMQQAALSGKAIQDVFSPNTTLGLLIAQATQTNRPVHHRRVPMDLPNRGGHGPKVVLLDVELIGGLTGMPMAGSGVLVRLRDPEAQRKLGRELQTADRMAAISRVSSGVAHEVKNPLNAMLLHVEVARAKLAHADTNIEPEMEIISSEIIRLDRVVKTFLDFTRPVELKLRNVPVRELLGEIADLARPQAEASGIRLQVEERAGDIEVRVDKDLVKQAFLNVVVNALEAMGEGGELRLASAALEDAAEIRISDTGPGIAPELREKIFRLYFTTKPTGSGIGLAMTFRIVQLHDGTIDFTSEPGEGTTFFIRLPVASV